jgi:hypothetical protein
MKNFVFPFVLVLFPCAFCVCGCDSANPKNKGQEEQPVVLNEPPQVVIPPVQENPMPDADDTVLVKAQVGVGARGNYGNSPAGMITAPVSAYFRTQEKIAFELNITRGMNDFKALNDGRVPESQEEFDEKIIKAYGVKLPPLPPNHKYLYDPTDGELKVQKPRE